MCGFLLLTLRNWPKLHSDMICCSWKWWAGLSFSHASSSSHAHFAFEQSLVVLAVLLSQDVQWLYHQKNSQCLVALATFYTKKVDKTLLIFPNLSPIYSPEWYDGMTHTHLHWWVQEQGAGAMSVPHVFRILCQLSRLLLLLPSPPRDLNCKR